jgi:hypothetical protein
MPMTYSSLIASKGNSGSIANWVGYGKLDIPTILDEAQSLIYSMLRTREMRTEWLFSIPQFGSQVGLPSRFLDPIGTLVSSSAGLKYRHLTEGEVTQRRIYAPSSGSLGLNALSTNGAGSTVLNVNLVAHAQTIGSDFTIAGGVDFNGQAVNGTYKVVQIIDANNIVLFNPDQAAATAAGAGGGAAITYTANTLVSGWPSSWAIRDEILQFDGAFDTATQFRLMYFRSPALLSASNPSNFLLTRYPRLVRTATQAAAADFMKDDAEYQKGVTALSGLIQSIAIEQDLLYRGADIEVDIP